MGGCCSNPDPHISEVEDRNVFYLDMGNQEIQNAWRLTLENLETESSKTPSWLSFGDQDELDKNIYLDDNCLICLEEFNELQHHPRILPCGHVICNECLIGLARSTIFTVVKCPQDRQVFRVEKRLRTFTGAEVSDVMSSAENVESENSGSSVHSRSSGGFYFPFRRNMWLPNDLPENSHSDDASIDSITLTQERMSRNLQNVLRNPSDKHVSTFSQESSSNAVNQQSSVSRISIIPRDGASIYEPLPDYPM